MPYPDSDYERSWKMQTKGVTLYPATLERLYAAAPEMLAVCKAIASDLSLFQFTDGEYRLSEQSAGVILQSLREVIAKAEGRGE